MQNGVLEDGKAEGLENDSPKQDLSRKRAMSDEDSDDDDVTGRKVSNILNKVCFCQINTGSLDLIILKVLKQWFLWGVF